MDEDDKFSSQSSTLGKTFRSMVILSFSILSLCLSTSLSTCIIYSGIGILDFTNTCCWLNSPGNKSSCAYIHVKPLYYKYSFSFPWGSCLRKVTFLSLKEDRILTSSLACPKFSILQTPVDKGKGGKDLFCPYEVKQQHHAHKFDKKFLEAIMYLVQNEATNVEP